jgi:hypothetical protein
MPAMKCRYCYRTLRVIPHTPAEIEPHCTRPGCCWCEECFRGETAVVPATRDVYEARLASYFDGGYSGRHRDTAA